MKYFHVFISLLIAICLTAVHPHNSLTPSHPRHHLACWAPSFQPRKLCQAAIKLQIEWQISWTSCRIYAGLSILSPVHSKIIITNPHFIQTESYYVITNFYLIWDRSQLLYLDNIVVITLDLSSTQVSCNNSDIILVTGCLTLVRIGWWKLLSSILLMTTEP